MTTLEPIEDTIILTKTKNGYEMKYLVQDDEPASPRESENLGKMICFHNHYDLGDKHGYKTENYSGWDELKKDIVKKEQAVVILPLILYDHSGLSMSITREYPFNDPWDSMHVGWIIANREVVLKEYNVKRITRGIIAKVTNILKSEVEIYNQYLVGDVYGIVRETYDADKQQVNQDSVWGFYGYGDAKEALKTEIG
jgi:hypothetical protein